MILNKRALWEAQQRRDARREYMYNHPRSIQFLYDGEEDEWRYVTKNVTEEAVVEEKEAPTRFIDPKRVRPTEVIVLLAMLVQILNTPGTKVEEHVHMQAVYDMIYSFNTTYDHLTFSGVVSGTFVGLMFLSLFGVPARLLFSLFGVSKIWMQLFVGFVLGMTVVFSFGNFARAVETRFGDHTAMFLRILTASQFHFLFYASRLLPDTFALPLVLMAYQRYLNSDFNSAVRWATAATVLFRCELVFLFGPILLAYVNGSIKLNDLHSNSVVMECAKIAATVLFVTIPLISFLWQHPVLPEVEAAWFNIDGNKSHEYDVFPFCWYFSNAIPRCLGSAFVISLSFCRFIAYAIPALNLAAAVFCARIYINQWKSWVWKVVSFGIWAAVAVNLYLTLVVYMSPASYDYPCFDAMANLQFTQRIDAGKPMWVYIDKACAQSEVTTFLQMNEAWESNQTKNLTPEDMERFDFLLIGTYDIDLRHVETNYTQYHRVMNIVNGLNRWTIDSFDTFPYIWPHIHLAEKVAIMRKKWEL